MRQLRLVGPSEDGAYLVIEAVDGERYRLPIDERLRAACRGDLSRLGQLEIEGGTLRPREIQARVRAGESAEQVAASAGMALERVLRFAYPMLQERQRVVAQARTTRVRRGGSTPAETLAELVDERLVGRGTDAATLSWDAWRREDGSWTVCLSWQGVRDYSARWTFNLARRTLQADDPAAEQLIAAEFHLRTITPVTQLAAAASRLAPESDPAPARRRIEPAQPRQSHPEPADRAFQLGSAGQGGTGQSSAGQGGAGQGSAGQSGTQQGAAGHRPSGERAGPDATSEQPDGDAARIRRAGPRRGRAGGERADATAADPGGPPRAPREPGRTGGPDQLDRPGQPGDRTRQTDDPSQTGEPSQPDSGVAELPLPLPELADPGDIDPDGDEEPGRRAHVPSWDDILLGVRRRH
ncbi:MAG: hypothetical protein V7637_61 [Mycobacteriales bacterium]